VASVITLIALPAIWLVNRDDDTPSSRPNVAAVGVDPGNADEAVAGDGSADTFDPMGDGGAAFLEAPTTVAPPGTVRIAVGTAPDELVGTARATYRRSGIGNEVCLYNGTHGGDVVTVVNVANGRSIECTTSLMSDGQTGVLIMSQSRFAKLAELTAAPIHVEVRQ
jgi:hypothetical protein